jgi:hypothetical protein
MKRMMIGIKMSIFNFGRKQRLGIDLSGKTSGKEMFKVDEYNQKKRVTIGIFLYSLLIFTIGYFSFDSLKTKMGLFFIILLILSWVWFYFNYKSQIRLREGLYKEDG